ncbi:MAG: DUF1269 domain-containing protein [Phototrophicales bacterium]|nr:MAG: hypothetical protein CUN56_09655 [Phototrophicales bacterium]RMG76373.1 MAG: DUF1269 domain-containing protein [Chloroflexota bacterium]
MTELIVMGFDKEQTAFQVRDKLIELQKQHIIQIIDAAIAVRKSDGKVKIKQLVNLTGTGALGGAFWGWLLGLIFWMPFVGMAIGALMGALSGALTDYGVSDEFIEEVGNMIQPGHSALFLLMAGATIDRVVDEIKAFNPTILRTNLSKEQEAKLREAFGDHDIES